MCLWLLSVGSQVLLCLQLIYWLHPFIPVSLSVQTSTDSSLKCTITMHLQHMWKVKLSLISFLYRRPYYNLTMPLVLYSLRVFSAFIHPITLRILHFFLGSSNFLLNFSVHMQILFYEDSFLFYRFQSRLLQYSDSTITYLSLVETKVKEHSKMYNLIEVYLLLYSIFSLGFFVVCCAFMFVYCPSWNKLTKVTCKLTNQKIFCITVLTKLHNLVLPTLFSICTFFPLT